MCILHALIKAKVRYYFVVKWIDVLVEAMSLGFN